MAAKWEEMALVGRVARAHGIHGQVIVNPETDFPAERFRPGAELFIERAGRVEGLRVTTARFHRERPVIGIDGIETMNDAETLAGYELRVPIDRLATLPPGTFGWKQGTAGRSASSATSRARWRAACWWSTARTAKC